MQLSMVQAGSVFRVNDKDCIRAMEENPTGYIACLPLGDMVKVPLDAKVHFIMSATNYREDSTFAPESEPKALRLMAHLSIVTLVHPTDKAILGIVSNVGDENNRVVRLLGEEVRALGSLEGLVLSLDDAVSLDAARIRQCPECNRWALKEKTATSNDANCECLNCRTIAHLIFAQ